MNKLFPSPFADVRKIVVYGVICMLFFAAVSCESSKSDEIASWRLVGIVNTETGILREPATGIAEADILREFGLREVDVSDCAKCFTLTFKPLNRFSAYSIVNEKSGNYTVDAQGRIIVTNFGGTRVFRPGDNELFELALQFMYSFVLTENELRLYSLLPENHHRFQLYGAEINNSYFLFELNRK